MPRVAGARWSRLQAPRNHVGLVFAYESLRALIQQGVTVCVAGSIASNPWFYLSLGTLPFPEYLCSVGLHSVGPAGPSSAIYPRPSVCAAGWQILRQRYWKLEGC